MKLTKLLINSGMLKGAALLALVASSALAQPSLNPCDPTNLYPGKIVFDGTLGVCWLAEANLAGKPAIQAELAVQGVKPNGTMNFNTALNWVAALNTYRGTGYLGHSNWQLPLTPRNDPTCAAFGTGGGFFGPLCSGGAMGHLFYQDLRLNYPDSVAPGFGVTVRPNFQDLKSSYYWAQSPSSGGGQEVYSFANGQKGGVTTSFPYYYVLPMVPGPIADAPSCLSPSGVLPYVKGPGAFRAVLDCATNYTWVADGNLAGQNTFGITGDVVIGSNRNMTLTVPAMVGGAMLFDTANQFVANMKQSRYLGTDDWQLPPDATSLSEFATDLGLVTGDSKVMFTGKQGQFHDIQPFYYWGCQEQNGMTESPCTRYAPPGGSQTMQWTFNFDDGFQGTAEIIQHFFVMVYFPAPHVPKPTCSNPIACCAQAGGYWSDGHCE